MYVVYGAGSIGSVLGARLARADVPVRLIAREAHAVAIREQGLIVEDADETYRVDIDATSRPEVTPDEVILLCTHAPAVADIAEQCAGRTVVTFQNGVDSEAAAAPWCAVIGAVWRLTCTLLEAGRVRTGAAGRIIVGRHPEGIAEDPEVATLASDLRAGGFDVGVSPQIAADKWLKVLVNTASAPNALVAPRDHEGPEFRAIKRLLLDEAIRILDAADIEARSCDGRDPSPQEMLAALEQPSAPRGRPVYNAAWRDLRRGLRPRARIHTLLVRTAEQADLLAPRHREMERLLDTVPEPESVRAADLLATL